MPLQLKLRTFIGIKQGQAVEWDESVTSHNILPAFFNDSSSDIIAALQNSQHSTFHEKVTLPDSSVLFLKNDRTATALAPRYTLEGAGNQIWETVVYGNNISFYNYTGGIISSTSMADTESMDITALPFESYSDTTVRTDSERTVFKTSATTSGASVTDIGSGDIITAISITQGGQTLNFTTYFNRSYLTIDSVLATQSSSPYMQIYYTYSTIGENRIATTKVTQSYVSLTSDALSYLQTNMSNYNNIWNNATSYISQETTTLSNISIP